MSEEYQSLAEMVAAIEAKRQEQDNINKDVEKADKEIAELEKAMNALKRLKGQAADRRWKLHKEIQHETEAMEALKRKLALEAEAARVKKLNEERRITLDELTATATWRDRILPHQLDGAHYLSAAQRAICADGMRLGKTLQSVVWLDFLQAMKDGGERVLVICPNDVIQGFEKEFNDWAPDRAIINLSDMSSKEAIETMEMMHTVMTDFTFLCNYEKFARSHELVEQAILMQFDSVILDEAHRLKQVGNATYKAIEQIVLSHNSCPICGKYCLPTHPSGQSHGLRSDYRAVQCLDKTHGIVEGVRSVKNVLPMTGTLILNRPNEAFASLHLVNDVAFPRLTDFEADYCTKGENGKMKWAYGGESRLVNKIKGMYIRRTWQDVGIKIPPQTVTYHDIDIDKYSYPLQTKILRDLAKASQLEISEGRAVTFFSILPLITRQRQAAVWPGGIWMDTDKGREHVGLNYLESAKLDKAVELYNDFREAGERVLIFSQFKEPLYELKARLGNDVVEFHGDTPKWKRDQVKTNFDLAYGEKEKWGGVLAHFGVGGEGLTMTAATQVIILDEQWNKGKNQQAYDRVMGMGQTQNTGVHVLRLKNSIDQWMTKLIEEKQAITDGFEREFTLSELEDLFKAS